MTTRKARILGVDDDLLMREALRDTLSAEGHEVQAVESAALAMAELEKQEWDIVLADLSLPRVSGLELLDRIKRSWPTTEVIVITGQGSIATAVDAIKRGAYHYLTKPFTAEEIIHLVHQALERRRLVDRKERLEEELWQARGVHQLVGQSEALRRVRQMIQTAGGSEATVLIEGESGTGKEIIANAIHAQSKRSRGPLVKMNCAAVPETLLESELFGHEKGAFTGADRRRVGRFEQAEGGTLFLDEVCEMQPRLQAKFLRALQDREVTPLGSSRPIAVDVRLIAATNQDLEAAVRAGRFREDLYYRLRVVELVIPPLGERREDVPLLVDHFLKEAAKRFHRDVKPLTGDALRACVGREWKGNVRELRSAIERALLLAPGAEITLADLPGEAAGSAAPATLPAAPTPLSFRDAKERVVEAFERDFLLDALRRHGGNVTKAAEEVGMYRQNFQQKMRELGITVEEAGKHPGEPR